MFARLSISLLLRSNHQQNLLDFSGHCYGSFALYSAIATTSGTSFLRDYLVKSLKFTAEEAEVTSLKLKRKRGNPDLAVNFFQEHDMDKTQIKKIVLRSPSWLLYDVERSLRPKIQVLLDLGISGSDLFKVVYNSRLFNHGLETVIRPNIDYLREVSGSDANTVRVIRRLPRILGYNVRELLGFNLMLLQKSGFSNVEIQKVLIRFPTLLVRNFELLEEMKYFVENHIGIPQHFPNFLLVVLFSVSVGKLKSEERLNVFRSFGWSQSDIVRLLKMSPFFLGLAAATLKKKLDFFNGALGLEPCYLAANPGCLSRALETRALPRFEVFKVLKENNLIRNDRSFNTMVTLTETDFLEKYVLPYKDKLPSMCSSYLNRMGSVKIFN